MLEQIFRKTVDQSLLKVGTTVPAIVVDNLLKKIGLTLTKGQKHKISIIITGEQYDAIITNVNFSGDNSKRKVVQIRYAEGSPICQKLKLIFSHSATLFSENKQETAGEKEKVEIPEADKEFVEVYAVGPSTVEFKCIPKSMKADFLKYLGKENDLSNYQRSYKLVFYKEFFELAGSEQEVAAYTLTQSFQQFYINRKQKGLVPDVNTDRVIEEVENSSIESILNLILKNPFAAISSKGFFTQTKKNEKAYFCMDTKLHQELNKADREMILDLVNKKIDYYFSRIDQDMQEDESMREKDPIFHTEGEKEMSIADNINSIKEYIAAKGFSYTDGLIENFYLCLKSKPFVILAGTSGTGKTRLVKLFAEAIGAEYRLVSIRPDWSDGSDLFGHYDLNGNFIEGPVCECFDKAMGSPNKPVFLCLDEMNLARVEYYLSDFLSVIESREKKADGQIVTSEIAQYKNGIPDNLYIVGTVNMDETTFPFSKKVLDRANTIEFSYVDLNPTFTDSVEDAKQLQISNTFLRTQYLILARDCADDEEYARSICSELQEINQILLKANAHVGYRVRDEIVFYMLNNRNSGLLTENVAMDNEIMQKILPRIQGSSALVKDMLCDLFKLCAGDYAGYQTENNDISSKMISAAKQPDCKYKKSAEKIAFMVRRYEEDGFTSYWL